MRKRLTKSSNNVVFTGTLAGIGEWLGIDPTIVRVLFVIISFFSAAFPGIFVYIILAIVIPSPRKGSSNPYNYNRNVRNENPYKRHERKQAEKMDDDDWSDF
ncbi:PspC domain-containing protein [Enterococcus sp. BWB1-3]|uniref:PspC domain-containing protein n=1 Tax=unclassified Enterococcus TaxID=2608891 RepID=UPI001921C434|nr:MULTISPECIES: PspC domain-containing protein [unclassified Enterococcus]MBL1229217.1 PspC domain-containing protein [Enterococcus sp. BWB1-3]MCB5951706.1 PspC domain-containing protein [Enterococcus sp. BWT-B8]MCB5955811.1 PspC domain-containing protein [Enterococcus sp. CWB-B31]